MYYIYHIPGIKVGCTDNLERRTWHNKWYYSKDIVTDVLETTDDIDVADERENYWSIKLGYGSIPENERYKVRVRIAQTYRGFKDRKHTEETKKSISEKVSGENNGMYGSNRVGEKAPSWGLGSTYKDLISGYEAKFTEMGEYMNITPSNINYYVKKNRPVRTKEGRTFHIVIV